MTGILAKGEIWTETDVHRGRVCEDTQGGESHMTNDASTRQEHQGLQEVRESREGKEGSFA